METPQFNKIYTIVGARGTGKTPIIMGGDFEQGLSKVYIKKGMSVLILDTLDHPKYRAVPSLMPKDFHLLSKKPGIFRTLANDDDMQIVIQKLKSVWNTLIVFEDCYKYSGTKFDRAMRTVIADSKQQNNDLIYMYPCWGWTATDLVRISNYFVVLKTSDGPECRESYLGGCAQEVMEAHKQVMTGKPHYIVIDSGI